MKQYATVLQAVVSAARKYRIRGCVPAKVMADFEKAIINASLPTFPDVDVFSCFFHLGQSMYRKIQREGLQEAYNDPLDRELKIHT